MADKMPGLQGKSTPARSLLLSPPGSGFRFDEMSSNSLLLPVMHSEPPLQPQDGEADFFLGQAPDQPTTEPRPFTFFQQPQATASAPTATSGDPFSQLGQAPPSSDLQNRVGIEGFSCTPAVTSQKYPPTQATPPSTGSSMSAAPHPDILTTLPPQLSRASSMPPADSDLKSSINVPLRQLNSPFSVPTSHGDHFPTVQQQTSPVPTALPVHHGYAAPHPSSTVNYLPVHPHWFYCKEIEKRAVWLPFSLLDSLHLEEEYNSHKDISGENKLEDLIVPTDGGRYDVHIFNRMRCPVYWEEEPTPVRRCAWFYRGEGEKRFIPYEEHFAEKLEEEYRTALMTNTWHRRLEFPGGETIIIHNPSVVVHFQTSSMPDEWGNVPEGQLRPRVVKRGVEEFDNIEDGEAMQIDHLVFVVHGIGGFCDLKFRTVTEVVDDFRSIGNSLLRSHFRKHVDSGRIGRVEFLPISWHSRLHGDATGIDSQLQPITLKSIPKLRYFANDTILDVLFYTSPVYCQTITHQVGSEINRMYQMFLDRNPSFEGKVSLIGHSLGSVILFDILLHQQRDPNDPYEDSEPTSRDISPEPEMVPEEGETEDNETAVTQEEELQTVELTSGEPEEDPLTIALRSLGLDEYKETFEKEKIDMESLMMCSENDIKDLGLPLGPRKKIITFLAEKKAAKERAVSEADRNETSRPHKTKPSLKKKRPILQRRKSLSTVNYMVGLAGTGQPFVSYPRLEFQPSCFFAVGSPIAMFLTVRGLQTIREEFRLPTCPAFLNIFHPFDPVAYRMEPLIDQAFDMKPVLVPHHKGRKRMHLEIKESLSRVGNDLKQLLLDSVRSTWNSIHDFARAHSSLTAQVEAEMDKLSAEQKEEDDDDSDSYTSAAQSTLDTKENVPIGKLNRGQRFDYVLQEKPIESFNEYLFALQSHMCYWESEDTVLLVLKEVYATMGISPTYQPKDTPSRTKMIQQNPMKTSSSMPSFAPSAPMSNMPPPSYTLPTGNLPPGNLPLGGMLPANLPPPSYMPPNTTLPPAYQTLSASNASIPLLPVQSLPSNPPPPSQYYPQRHPSAPDITSASFGMDPTLPPVSAATSGPPPLTGFVRQSTVKK